MKIKTVSIVEDFKNDIFASLREVFLLQSDNNYYSFRNDPRDPLKLYLEVSCFEVDTYFVYELVKDEAIYCLLIYRISDIDLMKGRTPKTEFKIARYKGALAQTDREAMEFMIGSVLEGVDEHLSYEDIFRLELELKKELLQAEKCLLEDM